MSSVESLISDEIKSLYLEIFHGYIVCLFKPGSSGFQPFSRSQGFLWDRIPEILEVAEYLGFLFKENAEIATFIDKIIQNILQYKQSVDKITEDSIIKKGDGEYNRIRRELISKFNPQLISDEIVKKTSSVMQKCLNAMRFSMETMFEIIETGDNFNDIFEKIGGSKFLLAFSGIMFMFKLLFSVVITRCTANEISFFRGFEPSSLSAKVSEIIACIYKKNNTDAKIKISEMKFFNKNLPICLSLEFSSVSSQSPRYDDNFLNSLISECIDVLSHCYQVKGSVDINDEHLLRAINKTYLNQACNINFPGNTFPNLSFISTTLYNVSGEVYFRLFFKGRGDTVFVLECQCENIVKQYISGNGEMRIIPITELIKALSDEGPYFEIYRFHFVQPCLYIQLKSSFMGMISDYSSFELSIVKFYKTDQETVKYSYINNELRNMTHIIILFRKFHGAWKSQNHSIEKIDDYFNLLKNSLDDLVTFIKKLNDSSLSQEIDQIKYEITVIVKSLKSKMTNGAVSNTTEEPIKIGELLQVVIDKVGMKLVNPPLGMLSLYESKSMYSRSLEIKHILCRLDDIFSNI